MRYESVPFISKEDAEQTFQHGEADAIRQALLSITWHNEDWQWVETYCLKFLEHPYKDVRAMAALCLGHLARIHRTIDTHVVVPALQTHLTDPDIAGTVSDALDDIEIFVGKDTSPSDTSDTEESK